MGGTLADGQLNAGHSRPSSLVRFAVARPADDPAIRRLLRENPMEGALRLTFEREPNYFRGAGIAGAIDQTIVAFDPDRVVCLGRCTTRDAWLNGRIRRVGYLAELRLDGCARGRFDLLRDGFRFFRELQADLSAEFYYTSIAADNARARQLLERGLPTLPRYEFLGELTTLLISTRTHSHDAVALERGSATELAEFFSSAACRSSLGAAWNFDQIVSLRDHHLTLEDFGVVRQNGEIVAAAALWDQRPFRQTVIRGYSCALRWARPLINAVGRPMGLSHLPPPGSIVSHAFLSPLGIRAESSSLLTHLIAAFCERAARRGIEFLTLALPSDDFRLPMLRRQFRTRTYLSRLYQVRWPDHQMHERIARPILPDVALL